MDEQGYRERARREGFEEPSLLDWEAGTFNETHSHACDCSLFVLSGEITIATDDGETTYRAGGTCLLTRDTPHTERVGPNGVAFLVARR